MSVAPDWLPPRVERGPLVSALAIGAALGALATWRAGALGAVVGVALAAALYMAFTARSRRRRAIATQPFDERWRRVLLSDVEYYARLDERDRARFEDEVRFFLAEHVVTGPRGAPLDDETRVLVAASAVIPIFGRRGFRYPRLRDVVVHDDAFDEDYQVGKGKSVLGMVHGQGPILLSRRALRSGFANPRDGHNVGLHEFAHVLDFDSGQADGAPSFMPWSAVRPWLRLIHRETPKAGTRASVLRRYAATHEAEFFAVATEAFFERPVELRNKHPELYAILRETYAQDPAAARD